MKLTVLHESRHGPIQADVMARKLSDFLKSRYGVSCSSDTRGGIISCHFTGPASFTQDDYDSVDDFLGRRGWYLTLLQKRAGWELLAAPIAGPHINGGKVWHCTALSNLPVVMRRGLIPSGKRGGHGAGGITDVVAAYDKIVSSGLMKVDDPRRITAAFGGYSPRIFLHRYRDDAIRMACDFVGRLQVYRGDGAAVLEVTLPRYVKLYTDPEDAVDAASVYTFTHIKPEWVKLLTKITGHTDEIYRARDPLEVAIAYDTG